MPNKEGHPVILLTGASSGIGLALAKLLAKSQYRIVLTARAGSLDNLRKNNIIENERILIRPLDVSKSDERQKIIGDIIARWGQIDVLVNNAGISYRSVIEHMTDHDEIQQFEVNYLGPMALIRAALPYMRKQRSGKIINISSVGGMMAMPTMGSYSASKFALEGASEALWYEMRPWNIRVSLIQPGFIHSNSFHNVRLSAQAKQSADSGECGDHTKADDYTCYYQHMSKFIESLMGKAFASPETVSACIMDTIADPNPPLRIPATIDAYFFTMLRRLLPRRFYHWLLYRNLPGINSWGKK